MSGYLWGRIRLPSRNSWYGHPAKTLHMDLSKALRGITCSTTEMQRWNVCEPLGSKRTTGQHPRESLLFQTIWTCRLHSGPVPSRWRERRMADHHFNFHDIVRTSPKLSMSCIHSWFAAPRLPGIDPNDIFLWMIRGSWPSSRGRPIRSHTHGQIGASTGRDPRIGTFEGMVEMAHPDYLWGFTSFSGLSHGANVWFENAQDPDQGRIADLAPAWVSGCRDQHYVSCTQDSGKMAFTIMEQVQKGILAQKIPERHAGYIEAMKANNVPEWYIEVLWKNQYNSRPVGSYVMMTLPGGFTSKCHPLYYYCAYFSIRAR